MQHNVATILDLLKVYSDILSGDAYKETYYLMHMFVGSTKYDVSTVQFSSIVAQDKVICEIERSEHERQLLWLAVSKDNSDSACYVGCCSSVTHIDILKVHRITNQATPTNAARRHRYQTHETSRKRTGSKAEFDR